MRSDLELKPDHDMRSARNRALFRGVALGAMLLLTAAAHAESLDPKAINAADGSDLDARANIAKLQILLDHAHFSPGVIDARMGDNVRSALKSFRDARGLNGNDDKLDDGVKSALGWGDGPVTGTYTETKDDVSGPFTKDIPDDFKAKSKLDHLGYSGPVEELSEKFHMGQDLMKELNPKVDFSRQGSELNVAQAPRADDLPKADRIEVDRDLNQVFVYGKDHKLVAAFPATVGSQERPSPKGELEVKGVAKDPVYTYSPDLDFSGVKTDKPFKIAPGPNNPVGAVWIDLNKDGYGIHGTPDPSEVGKTASHGCVRLTNWDAETLAKMVHPGMKVLFR